MQRPPINLPPTGTRIADPVLYSQLVWCEGRKDVLYSDGRGNLTGGIGWNFSANGLPDWCIELLYDEAMDRSIKSLDQADPWWRSLDPVRGRAVLNFMFNVGAKTYATFVQFRTKLQGRDWEGAAEQLENSAWFWQVGRRGPMIAGMIRTGVDASLA